MRNLRNQNNCSRDYLCFNEFTDVADLSMQDRAIGKGEHRDMSDIELSDIKFLSNRHRVPIGKLSRMFNRLPWVINDIKNKE